MKFNSKLVNSPLRYPGGKHWLVDTILDYIPPNTKEIVSPFLGGGVIELNLALYGIQVYGYDICSKLVNFWKHWLNNPIVIENEAKGILTHHTPEQLHEMKPNKEWDDSIQSAVWFYVYNRLAFGAVTDGSHVKEFTCQEGVYKYPKYQNHKKPRNVFPYSKTWEGLSQLPVSIPMNVDISDWYDTLKKHGDYYFTYLDPPYITTENLYGLNSFDHDKLYSVLKTRDNWILSYNDNPKVYDMYSDYHILDIPSRNFNTAKMTSVDTLIFSHDISEHIQSQPKQIQLFD